MENIQPPMGIGNELAVPKPYSRIFGIWGINMWAVADVWKKMKRVNRNKAFQHIQKIRKISQANSIGVRFEVEVRQKKFFDVMARARKIRGWNVFEMGTEKMKLASQLHNLNKVDEPVRFIIGTLNINGIKSKIADLKLLLKKKNLCVFVLQETFQFKSQKRNNLEGYEVIQKLADRSVVGSHGLAIIIKKKTFSVSVISKTQKWLLSVKLNKQSPVIITNVYIPCKTVDPSAKKEALAELKEFVSHVTSAFPGVAHIVMGACNTGVTKMNGLLKNDHMIALPLSGISQRTYNKGKKDTAIDHVMINKIYTERITGVRSITGSDISDHFPLITELVGCNIIKAPLVNADKHIRKRRRMEGMDATKIPHSARWEEIAPVERTAEDIPAAVQSFAKLCNELGRESGLLKTAVTTSRKSRPITASLSNAIELKYKLFKVAQDLKGKSTKRHAIAEMAYMAQRKVTKKLLKEDRRVNTNKDVVSHGDSE